MMAKPMKTLELHYPMIQFLIMRFVHARADMRALMTRKSCAVDMLNAILENHLKYFLVSSAPSFFRANFIKVPAGGRT